MSGGYVLIICIYLIADVFLYCKLHDKIWQLENKFQKLEEKICEKQMPKNPKERKAGYKSFDYVCPHCASRIISKVDGEWIAGNKSKHCYNCGQALDWSDTE